jgi:hypothetical protein
MGAISLRNVDPGVLDTLRDRARKEGRSLNSLICDILEREAKRFDRRARRHAQGPAREALRQRIFEESGEGTPSELLIREDRDR